VKLHTISGLFALLVFVPSLRAQDLRDPRFVARAETGFEHILNMDYDKAEQVFASLAKEYPQHPAPPLYSASIPWLKEMDRRQDLSLSHFIAPTYFTNKTNDIMPPQERTAFFTNLQQSESLCRAILSKNRNDKDGRYFMATAYGLRASFAITIDHSLREAFTYGNKCYSLTKQLTGEDPAYYDAYMSRGIYEYIVGLIPWYMRWMAFVIGMHGGKEEGLAHLKLAAEKGQYVHDQAELASMVLGVRERKYAEALELARDMSTRFPRSYLFPINIAQILILSGRKEEAIPVFLQVEKHAGKEEPNFDKLPLAAFRFNLGTQFMYMGKLDIAKERFMKAISDPQSSAREKALSHLYLGRILDWQKQPEEAMKQCRIVMSLADTDDSHAHA